MRDLKLMSSPERDVSSKSAKANGKARVDHLLIAEMVGNGARVLDVGCGDGELLDLLTSMRDIDGRGIEISQEGVNRCVARGLSVVQGDADRDLANYPDDAFDYAILSQTIQATRRPKHVLEQLLRIADKVIVSFPNFGHWRIRLQILFGGRMPTTENLPDAWYETANIHFCTIKDFVDLCAITNAKVERAVSLDTYGGRMGISMPFFLQNFFGEQSVFLLSKREKS